MELAYDRIHQGDCIKGMERLPEGSIDLAFADPPFNIGYDYDVYDDRRKADDYLGWSRQWISGVIRVLKPAGAFWLAIGDEYAAELKVLCTRELGLHCRNWVVWFYTFGVHCTQKFTRSHAHLFYFVKNPKEFTFNSLKVRVPSARQLVYGDKRADDNGRVPDDTWMMPPVLPADAAVRDGFVLRPQDIPDRFPPDSDTWYFSRVAGTFNERRGFHGCQMPEQLLGRIIRACSHEGEVVLDPFAGSGTTPAVAKKLGRQYIGFELSKKYVKKIEQRLASIQPGDPLIGPDDATLSAPKTSAGRRLKRAGDLIDKPVSNSPILARTNVSLGQVAVASGELFTAVAEAFMASHQGYSADRVLADPSLNERFLENCRLLSIPGEAKDWNHRLLGLRKRGGLSGIDTSRRTTITREAMAPFIYASEMAWRKVGDDRNCSLDEVLCNPYSAAEFERVARTISPGYSSFEYRWAALGLRKFASKGSKVMDKISDAWSPHVVQLANVSQLRNKPGHFLISLAENPFFAGFARSLGDCALFNLKQLDPALNQMGVPNWSTRDIKIQTRFSDISAVRRRVVDMDEIQWEAARRAKVLNHYKPTANVLLSSSAA